MKKSIFHAPSLTGRICLLLMAFCLSSVASVWAADETTTTKKVTSVATTPTAASSLQGGGYFLIKAAAKNQEGYVYYRNGGALTATNKANYRVKYPASGISTDTIGDGGSLAFVWYVSTSPDHKVIFIQNAGSGAFFPGQNGQGQNFPVSKTLANAATYYYSQAYEKGVLLYQTNYKNGSVNYYIHSNDDGSEFALSYWSGANAADGTNSATLFTFYPVTLAEGTTTAATTNLQYTTFEQQINGTATGVTTSKVASIGETATNPWSLYSTLYYNAPTVTPSTITSGQNVVVNFTETSGDKPIAFTTDENNPTYYRLKVRLAGTKWVAASTDNQIHTDVNDNYYSGTVNANDFAYKCEPTTSWYFVKDGLGTKIRNGNGKYINVGGTGNTATLADNGSTFYINTAPSEAPGSQFGLQYATNCYLGDHNNSNTRIGTWTSASNPGAANDKGSGYKVIATNTFNELKSLLNTQLNSATQPTSLGENVLRVATADQLTAAKAKVASATTLTELYEAYTSTYTVAPDANSYYRIKSLNGTNAYPSSEDINVGKDGTLETAWNANTSMNRVIDRKTESDKLVPQLWKFEKSANGTYKIRNANNNCCWAATASNIDMPKDVNGGGDYQLLAIPMQNASGNTICASNDGVSTFQILYNGQSINADATGTKLNGLSDDSNVGNYWQLVKVTTIPVSISSAKYATVGFPFTTKVTTDGVKVFYAKKAADGWVSLTEVADKIIPANQGAILYSESGATTANLEISSESATYDGNVLTATAAARVGFTALSTYGLALSSKTHEACFMKNSLTTVPANKCYLDATNYTETTGNAIELQFNFNGGTMTRIADTMLDANEPTSYYDLQGRRVLYPTHGIFVTSKGEKVLIK